MNPPSPFLIGVMVINSLFSPMAFYVGRTSFGINIQDIRGEMGQPPVSYPASASAKSAGKKIPSLRCFPPELPPSPG
jgi:hypothetical protein